MQKQKCVVNLPEVLGSYLVATSLESNPHFSVVQVVSHVFKPGQTELP